MRLVDEFQVQGTQGVGTIQLLVGDLSRIPSEHAVDVLAVSAFPNDYLLVPGTLIAALDRAGVPVGDLARDKEHDLRATSSCWLSRPLQHREVNAGRILCFEPLYRGAGSASQVVGDVFRSLVPFATAEPWVRTVAMPLLASGKQREPGRPMLVALVEDAAHWMGAGLPLSCLKVVLFEGHRQEYLDGMASAFADIRRQRESQAPAPELTVGGRADYDVFISYAHEDSASVDALVARMKALDPGIRIFMDRLQLEPGAAWQQRIFEAVSASRQVLCLYSPDYLQSKPCMEELHVGWLREREEGGVLVPAYLRSAQLPAYLRLIQYTDVRERDEARLAELASTVIERLGPRAVPLASANSPKAGAGATPAKASTIAQVTVPRSALEALLTGDLELHVDVTVRLTPAPD